MPLAEKSLIAHLRRVVNAGAGRARPGIVSGIGDDCAVLNIPAGEQVLVTTDFSLEGIHFRREWHPPESIGHRCLARGLSDIAAMGGEPVAALLSLALPRDLRQTWVDTFMQGFLKLAEEFQVTLVGGDTAESPTGLLADVVVVGRVPTGEALLRSGAQPGDSIYVTGWLGQSAATIAELQLRKPSKPVRNATGNPHFYPTPRLGVGRRLRERRLASAAIDVSDGLSTDLGHICEESGVGARVYESAIPRNRGVTLDQALHGGEDYELLFTVPGNVALRGRIAGVPLTRIGEIVGGSRMYLVRARGEQQVLEPRGWEYFRS